MAGIGHNNGPSLDGGLRWRRHCWIKARRDLIPHLPIEVLRRRVRRAEELGLEYRTYASVRASTGRDVFGFLFSSNALRVFDNAPQMPEARSEKLKGLRDCAVRALVSAPVTPTALLAANQAAGLSGAFVAPDIWQTWPEVRARMQAALADRPLPADGVLLVGDAGSERDWSEAGRLAGYVGAEQYFGVAGP